MLTNRLHLRTASSRGGFTLVELLVVIGIIAILAGVALGPITNAIKKAKDSSGVTSAHSIGVALFSYANDNSQTFPDSSGATADTVAAQLMSGGYITDASVFHLSGDKDTGEQPLSSSNDTASTIGASTMVSWDFMGNGGSGVDSTKYTFLPIVWSHTNTMATFSTTANGACTASTLIQNDPFSTDGVAAYYINNSSAFVTSTLSGSTYSASLVSPASNLGGFPTTYAPVVGN